MKKTVKIFNKTLLVFAILLVASCNNWDEHYNQLSPTNVEAPKPLPDLAEAIQSQTGYSYVSTILESGELKPYFDKNRAFTLFVFTDEQFDNTVSGLSSELSQVLQNDSTYRMSVVKATLLRNAFTHEEKTTPKGEFKTFDGAKVNVDFDVTPVAKVNHGTVYAYTDNIVLFPEDFFTIMFHPESWTSFNMGGGSSRTNVTVPEAFDGNGGATWFSGGSAHLIINIGGVVDGKSYSVIDGVNYKIRLCVGLYKSIKCQFMTYNKTGGDQKIYGSDTEYFDTDNEFVNGDINKGMRIVELNTVPLYNKSGMTKFHIDFRNRTFPLIDGVAPTTDQRGIIIDYIEFIPVFN